MYSIKRIQHFMKKFVHNFKKQVGILWTAQYCINLILTKVTSLNIIKNTDVVCCFKIVYILSEKKICKNIFSSLYLFNREIFYGQDGKRGKCAFWH